MPKNDKADHETDAFSILRQEAVGTPFSEAMNALPNAYPNQAVRAAWEQFIQWYARDFSALTRRFFRSGENDKEAQEPEEQELRQEGETCIGAYLEAVRQWHEQTQVRHSDSIEMPTSQEFTAFAEAQSDGKTGRGYISDPQALTRTHRHQNNSHYTTLTLTESELADGLTLGDLERFTGHQDADGILATCYVLGLLLPQDGLSPNATPYVVVDLNDLLEKIGFDPRTTKERDDARRQAYEYLRFGERARVVGERTVPYKDKRTGKILDTRIDATLWTIGSHQRPVQLGAFESLEVPVRVQITLTPAWLPLLSNPNLRQFLPYGEVLASIPGRQAGGAWARVIGLALAGFWRRHPRETEERTSMPTRRELLTLYTPKTADAETVLKSGDPARARKYWMDALQILKGQGFVADEGEVHNANATPLPRKGWQDAWLDEHVAIWPGAKMQPPVQQCAKSLPANKPRRLASPPANRRKKSKAAE